MAFCSKCGTELTEGAKFCPKCGNSVQPTEEKPKNIVDAFKEGWQQGANESQNEPSENESLSTWEKIALGVAGFVSFTGICGGVANGMWIVVLVSLCALGAICAVFMGTIEKKYAWTTAIVSFLVVSGAIGASTDDKEEKQKQVQTEQKQVQTEQKKESPAEKQAREKKEQADREANEKQEKIKRVAEVAYKMGYDTRKATWGETLSARGAAEADYRFRYAQDPEDAGQSERWNVFLENYSKGFSDAAKDIEKKFDQEDF